MAVDASEVARVGAIETTDKAERAEFRFTHWVAVRRTALALYLIAFLVWTTQYGISTQRELVILWVCGALVCASIGRHPRQIMRLLLDWAPIVAVLAVYDLTRGAADEIGIDVHHQTMIDVDRFLFFGQTPTEWLQDRLYEPGVVNWWDAAFSAIYTSYFIVPFALAGLLWVRDHPAFLRFSKRLVTLAIAGLITYILFPASPPWMAGQMGLLEEVHRSTSNGFNSLGVGTVGLFERGQSSANLVAAVPSLHSAFTALVVMFLWSRVRRRWRPLLAAYPVAMGLTLVATGEHYVFDVLLGWSYAGAVMLAWAWWERRSEATEPAMAPEEAALEEARA